MTKSDIDIQTTRLRGLSREELSQWAQMADDGRTMTTLVMPMERKGAETRKNPIVFKNAVSEAADKLRDVSSENDDDLLTELEACGLALENPTHDFWQHQDEGLIMILSGEGTVRALQTPMPLTPWVHVGPQPYLSPLLPLLDDTRPYVLVLDLNELRLLRATRWAVDAISLEGVPCSFDEAMRFDDPEESLQNRRVSSANLPGPGGDDLAFHGHGVTGDETRNKKIRRFFEQVDKGLSANFEDREEELVLFGPDAEVGMYREVNHYPHLCEDDIRFNASRLSWDDLCEKVRHWVGRRADDKLREALDRLEAALGQDQGSSDLEEVLKAAADGRIATLFVKEGERRFGTIDRASDRVDIHEEAEPGDEELLGSAATRVALTGGEVHYVDDAADLPGKKPAAAVFRY